MTSPAPPSPLPASFREALDQFGSRVAARPPDQSGSLGDDRDALEGLSNQAGALGRHGLARVLKRLAILTEVWECLAAESPGSTGEAAAFRARAYEQLVNGSLEDEDTLWVLTESAARWNDYLDLLDPTATTPDAARSDEEDPGGFGAGDEHLVDALDPDMGPGSPSIDAATLLRLLTGGSGGKVVLDPMPQQEPEPEPVPREPAPVRPRAGRSEPMRPAPDLDPELREAFLAEAGDLFERIESLVLGLRSVDAEGNRAGLHELGRCLHTLKGAAGSVGLSELAARIHILESSLEDAAGRVTPGLLDQLHETLSTLEGVLNALRHEPTARAAAPRILDAAPAPVQEPPSPSTSPIPSTTPPNTPSVPSTVVKASAPGEPGADSGPVRVAASRIDELMDIASELILRRGAWKAQTDRLKEFAASVRAGRRVLRDRLERLDELGLTRSSADAGSSSRSNEIQLAAVVLRLVEQVEDLMVLSESAEAEAVPMADESDTLARLSLQLWESLHAIRIVPVRGLFQRLARVALDAARVEGRTIEVSMAGEETGLDRALQDKAFEPLLHIVRNAVGHGIEPDDERACAGKPAAGRVTLEAQREGSTLVLAVEDDGRGLDLHRDRRQGPTAGPDRAGRTPRRRPAQRPDLPFRASRPVRKPTRLRAAGSAWTSSRRRCAGSGARSS